MFNQFTMSKESWGNVALLEREAVEGDLVKRNAGKILGDHNKGPAKTFEVFETESITVSRKSKPKTIVARGMDHASEIARTSKFDFEYDPLFDDVSNLIRLSTNTDPAVRRTISTRKSS